MSMYSFFVFNGISVSIHIFPMLSWAWESDLAGEGVAMANWVADEKLWGHTGGTRWKSTLLGAGESCPWSSVSLEAHYYKTSGRGWPLGFLPPGTPSFGCWRRFRAPGAGLSDNQERKLLFHCVTSAFC